MTPRTVKSLLKLAKDAGLSSFKFSQGEDALEAVFTPPPAAGPAVVPLRSASESAKFRGQRETLRDEAAEARRVRAYAHSGAVPIVKEKG